MRLNAEFLWFFDDRLAQQRKSYYITNRVVCQPFFEKFFKKVSLKQARGFDAVTLIALHYSTEISKLQEINA